MGKKKCNYNYNCKIGGKVYNLQPVQKIIKAHNGNIDICEKDIMDYLCDLDLDIDIIINLPDIIKLNNNQIPEDFDEGMENLREYNDLQKVHPTCPICGSNDTGKISFWDKTIFNGKLDKTFECTHCGHAW